MSANTIITSVITGGTNNHTTVAEEANAYATDFVNQGVVGAITANTGSGGTGSFCVNADASPDLGVTVLAGQAYISATPSSQDAQVVRARASANYTAYTINANASGSTKYDWIYLQVNATNANNPDAAADNVTAIYTSRSTSNASDTGSPPTYGLVLAVVTVINGASSITNASISDRRVQSTLAVAGTPNATGWNTLGYGLTYSANNGNKEFAVTSPNNLTNILSPGMKVSVARSVTPPTQSMAFASASSQYATKASPTGISFTAAFTCEAWIYLNSYTGSAQTIIQRRATTSGGVGWFLDVLSSGQLEIAYAAAGSFTTWQTYQSIPLNQWVHVAGVVSSVSGKTLQGLYINGTSVPSSNPSANSTTLTQGGNLTIGAYDPGSSNYFNGYISEARVWSVAQTAANIQANMAINCVGNETNLVALFQGNGNFNDATSNANNLTAQAGAIATQAANPYNAIEYANIRAITYSNPTTTITLYTSDAGTIPNQTLNTPYYSVVKEPYGLPEVLNSKILGQIIWCTSMTNTATAAGTQMNGATMTITIPTSGKKLRLRAFTVDLGGGTAGNIGAYWGAVSEGVALATGIVANLETIPFWASSGSQTFSLDLWSSTSGTATFTAGVTDPGWFTVEEA